MRGAAASTIAKACLFALIWHVAIALLPRGEDMPWLSVVYALLAAFSPIVVAVNMGYHAASRERTRTAAPLPKVAKCALSKTGPVSEAITRDLEKSAEPSPQADRLRD